MNKKIVDTSAYRELFTAGNLMGPNSALLLGELLNRCPSDFDKTSIILDLGCGKGLTSLVIHKETSAIVYANDLWISQEENGKRFADWGLSEVLIPTCEDANHLTLKKDFFDALISIDSYHYFAGKTHFFEEKILPHIKSGGYALIAIPGIKNEFSGRQNELLGTWLKEEAYMFKSPDEWKRIIGDSDQISSVEIWEMDCFEQAWADWLDTENEYALNDKLYYESIIHPYTNFVGIMVKKK